MAREGARATENALILSPSAGSAAARLLGCREGMQGGQNMPWKGSRATDDAQIPSPSISSTEMRAQKRRERMQGRRVCHKTARG